MNEDQVAIRVNSDHDRVRRQRAQRFREPAPAGIPRITDLSVIKGNRPQNPRNRAGDTSWVRASTETQNTSAGRRATARRSPGQPAQAHHGAPQSVATCQLGADGRQQGGPGPGIQLGETGEVDQQQIERTGERDGRSEGGSKRHDTGPGQTPDIYSATVRGPLFTAPELFLEERRFTPPAAR